MYLASLGPHQSPGSGLSPLISDLRSSGLAECEYLASLGPQQSLGLGLPPLVSDP